MIPMVDLHQQYKNLKTDLDDAVAEVLNTAHYVLGPNVHAFEQEAAKYLGANYAVSVANGTDALHLALIAAEIGPGDEVITPSFTFIATVESILYRGAIPVFIDLDPSNFNLDLNQLEKLITPKTKAIMPVHLYGNPVDMTQLMDIAQRHNLKVIEDACQSFGARWQDKMTGTFGDFGCYSFYPSKNLGCFGDGGLITTNSPHYYQELIALRNHGSYTRYHHEKLGYNSRLDEIQAAILRVKLPHLDTYNKLRHQAAQRYTALLKDIVTTPQESIASNHIYHQYTILHPQRDAIQAALKEANIASAIYYPIPIHEQPLFKNKYAHLELPHTEEFTAKCLSLPMFPELTSEQITKICDVIRETVK
ncbi:MAG: DegT/DnrJ/EryC1/StrS family aminotransferase [Gammaproteobacteria bacterium]|nr:DegT/DnrJ/EryC1/StrS family aminotransferase [Gammaproteobacteria bacterium]